MEHYCSDMWYSLPMLPVDVDSLSCFLAVAEHLHFREAASRVGLSPPALSDRIRRLEEDLGVTLFERTTRTVALTQEGLRLRPAAQAAVEASMACRVAVRDPSVQPPYSLTLGSRYELGMSWLVPALKGLSAAAPARTLHLALSDGEDLLKRTVSGSIDAMISSQRLTRSDLAYAPLHDETYTFVAAHSLIARRPLHGPADAAEHTLLDIAAELPLFRYFLDAHPRAEVWGFDSVIHLSGIGPIRHRILEGAGVAVLPTYFIQGDLDAGRLVVLQPEIGLRSDTFRLVWRRGHPLQEPLRELAEELRALPLR